MRQYRKRPVVVEAVQFTGSPAEDPPGVFRHGWDLTPYVVTIHGQRCYIEPGDWVVAEPDGIHHYPVKPDIFAENYEAVENVEPAAVRTGAVVCGLMARDVFAVRLAGVPEDRKASADAVAAEAASLVHRYVRNYLRYGIVAPFEEWAAMQFAAAVEVEP